MNGKKTLIAYVTKSGVTGENAEIIAEVLKEQYQMQVDLVNLKENSKPDLSQYHNVIIGSGVRIGMWYGKAKKILKNKFNDKKVAIFLSSGMAGDPATYDEAISKFIDKKLEKYPHIKPIATEAFGGRYREDDWTDPEKVRAWADELGKKLTI
ncbi:MAG: flavodoxin domain-containing protein [Promethearchaeota archaeon]|jgi:menaquinone-dependent protoporphyrinogen IX oxidase